ncbi:MAG TPA: hypothetical protein PLD25_19470 [Chloroflexota bacterium]|nr:hypothetical protein [Chloroflexota bacterium]
MSGLYVVVLDRYGNKTDRRIVDWTRQHGANPHDFDNIVAVDFNLGGFIRFSNSLEGKVAKNDPNAPINITSTWDPANDPQPPRGGSQHTAFDDQPLSSRDEGYQATAVNWFVEFVLSNYLQARTIQIDPTPEVMARLGDRTPEAVAEITALLCDNPNLINNIQITSHSFVPEQISPAVKELSAAILENKEQVAAYLAAPESYVDQYGRDDLSDLERRAFVSAAQDKGDLVRHAFDCVELGRGRGDGNVYVLIGWEEGGTMPDPNGLDWFGNELPGFVANNNFVPGFGWYVTEARMRYHVILGPGVTDRDRDFLAFFGHRLVDRRDGQEIGVWLAPAEPPAGIPTTE